MRDSNHKDGLGCKMKNPVIRKYPETKKNLAPKELGDELGPYSLRHGKEEKAGNQDVEAIKTVGPRTQDLTGTFL